MYIFVNHNIVLISFKKLKFHYSVKASWKFEIKFSYFVFIIILK